MQKYEWCISLCELLCISLWVNPTPQNSIPALSQGPRCFFPASWEEQKNAPHRCWRLGGIWNSGPACWRLSEWCLQTAVSPIRADFQCLRKVSQDCAVGESLLFSRVTAAPHPLTSPSLPWQRQWDLAHFKSQERIVKSQAVLLQFGGLLQIP